ncbi:RNA-binding protein 20 isoform X2 [Heptranchias perlo]|uniref:RNA-binding protein 20 isoform X2 n=1 Tax=Heptranchias perlo TaxID=212740 RepID=UPI00355A1CFB
MKKQASDCGVKKQADDMATNTSVSDPTGSRGVPPIPQIVPSVAKILDKNPLSISTQLSGGVPNPILPSPASVQLAQLQAHLTLQRLKFAQSAVNSNTAAATVLSHVLTKVAMSQPLFNTLRTPSLINATHGQAGGAQLGPSMSGPGMPPGGLPFPSQTPGLPPLVAGGISQGGNLQPQNPGPIRLNPFAGMVPQPPAHSAAVMNLNKPVSSHPPGGFSEYPGDFSNKTNVPNNHTYNHDEVLCTQGFHQFGFSDDMSNALSANLASGNPVKGHHILNQPHPGFQQDFQNTQIQQMCRMQAPGYSGEMNAGGFPQKPEGFHQVNLTGNSQNQGTWASDQWQNSSQFLQPNRPEFAAQSHNMWPSKSQQLQMRNELYNPEEPTSEGKLNIGCPPHFNRFNNNQNFTGPQFNPSEQQLHGASHPHLPERQLQPHELNDFHGLVPSQLPHICSICDKKVFNLKDWEHHVNGKHHIQNCTLFSENSGIGSTNFTRSTNGGVNSCGTSTVLNPSDFPSDNSQSHLSVTSMRMFPQPSHGFSSTPSGSKFPQRKPGPSRVVHICNLPEGSCTEGDVINLGLPFGKVTNYILMRATNQAFLEMAYPEAAQAMVQFYQQKPPVINEQQLLVRMSKQYKELKLKKPGKNVESIINDINSQKEREMHKDWDRFPLERTRSRSPLTRSLSPRMESHSPSLTSCCSSQRSSMSPRRSNLSPMATNRGERNDGMERKGSRDYLSHKRKEEKNESLLRNYCEQNRDGTDKWGYDRKQYLKPSGRSSPKSLEDRGDGHQGHKDKYAKSSLQNPIPSQSKYKIRNEEDYKKEQKLKSVRSQHSPRTKGKDNELLQRSGKRRTASSQDQTEDKGEYDSLRSPAQIDRLHIAIEKDEKSECAEEKQKGEEDGTSDTEVDEEDSQCFRKQSSSPLSSGRSQEPEPERNTKEQSATWESGSEAEGEAWYSCSMEEFVTVDEVGEEEDHSMEIQLEIPEIKESDCIQTEQDRNIETSTQDPITKGTIPDCGHPGDNHRSTSPGEPRLLSPTPSLGSDRFSVESASFSQLTSNSMNEIEQNLSIDVKQAESPVDCKNCEMDKVLSDSESIGHLDTENQCRPYESYETDEKLQRGHFSEEILETQGTDQSVASISLSSPETDELKKESREAFSKENLNQPIPESAGNNQQLSKIQQPQLPWEQDNVFCNLSIPLGVEFVEARTGFYCKLCGLFYITEEAAKTSHCRSTVHYKNLQKYLSQLAEESLKEGERDRNPGTEEEVGIMPQFESKKSNPS